MEPSTKESELGAQFSQTNVGSEAVRGDSWSCGNTNYDFDKEAIIYYWKICVGEKRNICSIKGGKKWMEKN